MKQEFIDVDEIAKKTSKISNRLNRLLIKKMDEKNELAKWGVKNKQEFIDISKKTKLILMDEVKKYFSNKPYLPLYLKEEIIKQNMMNYFASNEFFIDKNEFKVWNEAYLEILKKEKSARDAQTYFGGVIPPRPSRNVMNVELYISEKDYTYFTNEMIKKVCLEATFECLHLSDSNIDISNEIDLNNNQKIIDKIKETRQKTTSENISEKRVDV